MTEYGPLCTISADIERAPHASDDGRDDQTEAERLDIFMKMAGRLRADKKQRHDQKHHDGADRKTPTLLIFTQFAQSLHCDSMIQFVWPKEKPPEGGFSKAFRNAQRGARTIII